jgi:hypothetical protein
MATAIEVAEAGLKRILVQAADAPLEPDEYQDFYSGMNHYMAALEADGIRLGYTPITDAADAVTVPAGAIRGLIANVAIEVSPDYGGSVSRELISQAAQGLKTMRRLGQNIIQVKYPTNLPLGSGSDEGSTYRTVAFYTLQDSALLSLAGNTAATIISTIDVMARVAGEWAVEASKGFRGDISGAIQNQGNDTLDMDVKLTFTATGNSTYTFTLLKNGASVQASVASALTSTPADLSIKKLVELAPGDYIELWVENDVDTENVTVTDAQFRLS